MLCGLLLIAGCSKQAAVSDPPVKKSDKAGSVLDGEALFKQYCSTCHPDGGNVNDPGRNLHGSALRASRITTPEDIVRVMRKPVSRMIRLDEAMLPDPEARAIAEYVLKTYR